METISEILNNHVLLSAVTGWLVAQVLKTLIYACLNQSISWERMIGSGGMPSSHSSTVTALATATAFEHGIGSTLFAISLILAIIVMHDASGVRQETGKQAKVLNQILESMMQNSEDGIPMDNLKELVGHTHLQVFMGAILGICISLLLYLYIF